MVPVDYTITVAPLAIAGWACVRGIQLYQHAVRRESYFRDRTGEKVHLRFLREVSLATCVLALIYGMAKARDLFHAHAKDLHDVDLIMWAVVDSAVFAVLALLCLHGKHIADTVVKFEAVSRKNKILRCMIDAAGGFVWVKDAEGKYLFCDRSFCAFFFGTQPEESVEGFTDVDLLDAFRIRTGKQHTYGSLCMNTDAHCRAQGKKCRYLEIGYIDGDLVILDVVKTPQFAEDGTYEGTVGMAWERSEDCEHIQRDIVEFKKEGRLVELCHGVFWVKENPNICRWQNPLAEGPPLEPIEYDFPKPGDSPASNTNGAQAPEEMNR